MKHKRSSSDILKDLLDDDLDTNTKCLYDYEESVLVVNNNKIIVQKIHRFVINDTIEDISDYMELIKVLRKAKENEVIYIYLQSDGGCVSTGMFIKNAITQCNGEVITCLNRACSMAAMLFLAGHKHIVYDYGEFMLHTYSTVTFGKGNEIKSTSEYNERVYSKLLKSITKDFLTPDECDTLINVGRDMWLESDEVLERLINMGKTVLKGEYTSNAYSIDSDSENNTDTDDNELSSNSVKKSSKESNDKTTTATKTGKESRKIPKRKKPDKKVKAK